MIPGWLKSLFTWLAWLFAHEAAEQVKEEIEKPDTITDEKVPQPFADALQRDIKSKLDNLNGNKQ